MSETLFDGYEPGPLPLSKDPALSADRRRTERQREQITRGIHPLTGTLVHPLADTHANASDGKSQPYRCGSCYFREVLSYHGKAYPKCTFGANTEAPAPRISHSTATDVRAWWPACRDYSPSDPISPDAARSVPGGVR